MRVKWRKALAQASAELSGDIATDIPAPAPGSAARRVRLFITPRAPAPPAARGILARIVRDLSDRSERGDPKALFSKYGAALVPMG